MVNRRTLAALAAIGTIAAGNLVAGCVKSGSDSTFFPPTPTPAPPATIRHCTVVWTAQNADVPSTVDALVLDAPADAWVNGPALLATSYTAGFQYYFLSGTSFVNSHIPNAADAVAFSVADTSGSTNIVLTVNGTQPGADVAINDGGVHQIYGLDTAGKPDPTVVIGAIGTAGALTFDGTFGDISGASVGLGNGSANAVFGTQATMSLGGFGSYAGCYDVTP